MNRKFDVSREKTYFDELGRYFREADAVIERSIGGSTKGNEGRSIFSFSCSRKASGNVPNAASAKVGELYSEDSLKATSGMVKRTNRSSVVTLEWDGFH